MFAHFSDWVPTLIAQSSTRRKSQMMSFCTLDFSCSLHRLKWYLMPIPISPSWKGFVSTAKNIMLNREDAITQPCLMKLVTRNGWGLFVILHSGKHTITELPDKSDEPVREDNLEHDLPQPIKADTVKGLIKSTKVVGRLKFCSWHFSCKLSCGKYVNSFMALLEASLTLWQHILLNMLCHMVHQVLAKIFPVVESRKMSLWLWQSCLFPFYL